MTEIRLDPQCLWAFLSGSGLGMEDKRHTMSLSLGKGLVAVNVLIVVGVLWVSRQLPRQLGSLHLPALAADGAGGLPVRG
jgi:hypothetical protein